MAKDQVQVKLRCRTSRNSSKHKEATEQLEIEKLKRP